MVRFIVTGGKSSIMSVFESRIKSRLLFEFIALRQEEEEEGLKTPPYQTIKK